jgi:cytoskeletal protein CcmA (bactofilin family)
MGKNQSNDLIQNTINMIGKTTNIVGDVVSESDIRIDGNVKGTIQTKGKIVVGQSGIILGNIICQNAEIEGKIEGKIKVNDLLSLKATANVQGEIVTGKLAIEPNAIFTGTCKMGDYPITSNEE